MFGGVLGSCHALDIPFALNNLDRKGVELFTGDAPARRHLAVSFSDSMTTFMHTRDTGWPQWGPERNTQLLDANTTIGVDVVSNNEPRIRQLWEALDAS